MNFLRRVCPVVVVLSVALAACGGAKDDKAAPAASDPTPTTAPAPVVADLTSLIVAAPPGAGYEEITGVFAPFDLQGYLDDFSTTPDADRALLTAAGFVRGDARGWINGPETNFLAVFVLEFQDGAGAQSARADILEQSRILKDGSDFDVAGLEDARGQTYLEDTDSGPEAVDLVALVRDNRLFLVAGQHADPSIGPDLAIDLATAQAAFVD